MNTEGDSHFLNLNNQMVNQKQGMQFNPQGALLQQQQFINSPMMGQHNVGMNNPNMANFLRQQQQFARDANIMQDQNLMGMSPSMNNQNMQFVQMQSQLQGHQMNQQFSPNPQQMMMSNTMVGMGMQQDWRVVLNQADRLHVVTQL